MQAGKRPAGDFMGSSVAKQIRTEALEEGKAEMLDNQLCPFGRCAGRVAAPADRCNACKRWDAKNILPRTQGICFACLKVLVPITRGRGDWAERTYHKTCWKALGCLRQPAEQLAAEIRIADDEADPGGAASRRQAEHEAKMAKQAADRLATEQRLKAEEEQRKKQAEDALNQKLATHRMLFEAWAIKYWNNLNSEESLKAVNDLLKSIYH